MIVLGDTCSIEYCFKSGLLEKVQEKKFSNFLITTDVLSEIERRIPDALRILKYSVVHLNLQEANLANYIVDLSLRLFGKDDITPADASIISVACSREIPIYSDNDGINWFFYKFLPRDYSKEPYKSARDLLQKQVKHIPRIYTSAMVIPELLESKDPTDLIDFLSNFTAESGFWFKKDDLLNLNIDPNDYRKTVQLKKKQ